MSRQVQATETTKYHRRLGKSNKSILTLYTYKCLFYEMKGDVGMVNEHKRSKKSMV